MQLLLPVITFITDWPIAGFTFPNRRDGADDSVLVQAARAKLCSTSFSVELQVVGMGSGEPKDLGARNLRWL